MIDSVNAGLPGADATALALCFTAEDNGGTAVLDPAKVAGKIVVCDRGVSGRTNKSLAVERAGGVGMILLNTSVNSLNADFHSVPTVHLQSTDRAAVKAYAALSTPTASIAQAIIIYNAPAPFTASFSSRGPLIAGGGDLLKPDLIAPGQDVLAAVAPPGNHGRSFDLYSGTSMSSPHVAGLGALMKELHPDWSPMAIKSALMTTGYDVLDGPNTSPLVIFRQGAGHVRPLKTADPAWSRPRFNDWLGFLCGTGQLVASYCPVLGIDPSDLNVASIAIGDMAGVQTVTRKVTNVGNAAATYTPSVAGMTGFTTVVSPASLALARGETKSFTVAFTRARRPPTTMAAGSSRGPTERTTCAADGRATGGPGSTGTGERHGRADQLQRDVRLRRRVYGDRSRLDPGSDHARDGRRRSDQQHLLVDVAERTADPRRRPGRKTFARFALFDADVNPGSDIDMCVFLAPRRSVRAAVARPPRRSIW